MLRLAALCCLLVPPAALAQSSAGATFLTLSDVHLQVPDTSGAGGFASGSPDTSPAAWTAAHQAARKMVTAERPDFVLYLGDMPAHDQDPETRSDEMSLVLDGLASIAGTDTRVYVLPGNNDSFDSDYCAFEPQPNRPPFAADPGYDPQDPGKAQASFPALNGWDTLIDTSGLAQGYFSAHPLPGQPLRLISLNTVMYTAHYGRGFSAQPCLHSLARAEQDRRGRAQVDWLADQLDAAAQAGEQVLLAMHVPPGLDGHSGSPTWLRDRIYTNDGYTGSNPVLKADHRAYFDTVVLQLVAQHADRIGGLLTAHTHLDDLRILQDCSGQTTALAIGVPAISQDHGTFPAMKHFTLNDHLQLSAAQTRFTPDALDWAQLGTHDFADTYCRDPGSCGDKTLLQVIEDWPMPSISGKDSLGARMHGVLWAGRASTQWFDPRALMARPDCSTP